MSYDMVVYLSDLPALRMNADPRSKWLLARDPAHLIARATSSARCQAVFLCTEEDKTDQAWKDKPFWDNQSKKLIK